MKIIAKILLFLLVQLGMWIPAVYIVGYITVCLICKIPLSNPVGVQVLWIGVAVLGVVGLIVSSYFKERQLREGDQNAVNKRPKPLFFRKKEKMVQREPVIENSIAPVLRDDNGNKYSYDPDFSDGIKSYSADTVQVNANDAPPYYNSMPLSPSAGEQQKIMRYSSTVITEAAPEKPYIENRIARGGEIERPLVFATRKDPNIIIFEYGDRLEYYLKPVGRFGEPRYLKTEFKRDL